MLIREERPGDLAAIRCVESRAFGRRGEADLVDSLRGADKSVISLVAEQEGRLVGHILFTQALVTMEDDGPSLDALALGPMAVLPERQNRGIGTRLVRGGLRECLRRGCEAVFLIGHASYYPRFGFVAASTKGIRYEREVPGEVFMVAELREGALAGRRGVMRFQPEFENV